MSSTNRINKVAIVGAGGNSGSFMTEELLKTAKHIVTAITRAESQSKLPEGIHVKQVDYSKPESLVEALRGQDALVITLSTTAREQQEMLIRAAGDAGVPWILPNEWSPDTANEALVNDVVAFKTKATTHKLIREIGKSSYIAVTCGFWYEWSVAIAPAFGFDIPNRTVTLFDDGNTKICTSTWPQVGRMVAGILSLPIRAEGGDSTACLEHFRNKQVYADSFLISQNEMFESVLRVTGSKREEWTVKSEPAEERYHDAVKAFEKGDRMAFARVMYTRVFFRDGVGNYRSRGTINKLLGLPEEDVDEATKVAVARSKTSFGR